MNTWYYKNEVVWKHFSISLRDNVNTKYDLPKVKIK